jgi:cob(I)alamin adenosyltransferase
MKLYTRTGDDGTTGLFGGARVPKDAARVEAYGTIDEANAALGWVAATLRASGLAGAGARAAEIEQVQRDLFRIGAELASPGRDGGAVPGGPLSDDDVARLERWIDAREAECEPLRQFILPGGSPAAAALHMARTIARRAERRVIALSRADAVRAEIIRYVNRLSDLLFAMARSANAGAAVPDIPWRRTE